MENAISFFFSKKMIQTWNRKTRWCSFALEILGVALRHWKLFLHAIPGCDLLWFLLPNCRLMLFDVVWCCNVFWCQKKKLNLRSAANGFSIFLRWRLGACCVNADLGTMAVGPKSIDAWHPALALISLGTYLVHISFLDHYSSRLFLDCLTWISFIFRFHCHKMHQAGRYRERPETCRMVAIAHYNHAASSPRTHQRMMERCAFGLYGGSHCYIFVQHSVQYKIWHQPQCKFKFRCQSRNALRQAIVKAEQQQQISTKIVQIHRSWK